MKYKTDNLAIVSICGPCILSNGKLMLAMPVLKKGKTKFNVQITNKKTGNILN